MWRVWLGLGWLVWSATLLASIAINALAGSGYGRTPFESQVFAGLGVTADLWKALGPIFIVSLYQARRYLASCLAGAVWLTCVLFAITAAIGLAAQNRSGVVGGREAINLSYKSAVEEIAELERHRASISELRAPDEIESAIDVILMRPVAGRGTVGSLSKACKTDMTRTRTACSEVAVLRQALATALEARRVDDRLQKLRQQTALLRERGGNLEADPQAHLISRLSFNRLAASDVGLVLILLLVGMVELISAFAPVVLHEFTSTVRFSGDAVGRGRSRPSEPRTVEPAPFVPDLFEYLAERIVPDSRSYVSLGALLSDFNDWCARHGLHLPSQEAFVSAFHKICERDLRGKIVRTNAGYVGFRLKG